VDVRRRRWVMCVIESTCRGCLYGILMDLVVHARESFANEGYSGVYGVDEFKVEFMKDAVLRDPYGTTHFVWLTRELYI
jgi:hypothetical protein